MSILLNEAAGFLDKYLISGALSAASGDALRPLLQDIVNQAWKDNPVIPPPFVLLAEGVAQGQVSKAAAYAWAKEQGYDKAQMDALVNIANVGPAIGEAFRAWRRIDPATGQTLLTDAQFRTALKRTALEDQWVEAIMGLKPNLLEPAEIAKAIHRGIMKGDGLLIAEPPTTPGKVPAVPPSNLNPEQEAAGSGISTERLRIMVGNAGLPLGLHEMLSLMNRGEMEPADVQRGIAESNLRNEYQDVALALARQLLTVHEYVEGQLRGYISRDERLAGTRLHGMTDADSDLLFLNQGRPLNIHQITTGLARGGKFQPEPGELTDPYEASVHEANIKPAYYDLAIANKYTLPSYFVIKAILADGGLTVDEATEIFVQEGWPPDLAAKAAKALRGSKAATMPAEVKAAVTKLLTTVRGTYLAGNASVAQVQNALGPAGLPSATVDGLLTVWDIERAFVQATSPAPPGPTT